MTKKTFNPTKSTFRVTFVLPAEAQAETVCLCGDFNGWDKGAHPMIKQKDGSFKLTLELAAGHHYHFRYFLNGERWENDWKADAYVPNPFGGEDSVIFLDVPSS
jgi:1,4-alpha-glucan branching enzyme